MVAEDQQYQTDLAITTREGNTLRLLGTLQSKGASNMVDYNFKGNFAAAPNGAFTNANKKKVWSDPTVPCTADFDSDGTWFKIIDNSKFPGGKSCRLQYPKDRYGMQDQSYQLRVKSPQTTANIVFYWMFETDFVFYNTNLSPPQDVGGGKIGPCINWGEIGGETSKRGTRAMWWWNAQGSNHPKPVFSPSCQDQRSGNQLIQPVKYTKPIELGRIYKFGISLHGGPNGMAEYYQDDVLIASVSNKSMMATATDDVIFDFAFFSGGDGKAYALPKDCYAQHGGVHYWSGTYASGANGGTPPNPQPEPIPPEPTPPSPDSATSPFSLAVGEKKIFQAKFIDNMQYPPKEVEPGGAVKWSLDPNVVTWGPGTDPMYKGIQVTGKTAASGAKLKAQDPVSGIWTEEIKVDVTSTPRTDKIRTGTMTVEPLPPGKSASADDDFKDEPPQ